MSKGFADGWHTQYPMLHFFILETLYAPLSYFFPGSEGWIALAGRLLTVMMALGCLFFLYKLAKYYLGAPWAVVAVSFFAFSPQTVYYAKLANLEIPYTFWLIASFYVLTRILESHRYQDYLLFTFCAMAAICTKEQVFGFYVLLVPFVFYQRYRSERVANIFLDKAVYLSGILAFVCFVVFENILFNPDGFIKHLALITGAKFQSFRMFRPELSGHWGMVKLSLTQMSFVASIPIFFLSVIGISIALWRRERFCWLILAALSYQLFFIHIVLYSYDRFYVPTMALLAIFAAYTLKNITQRAPRLALTCAAILIGYQFTRGTELNLMMLYDTRYEAEAWLETIPKDRVVGLFNQRRYLPRFDRFTIRKDVYPFRAQFSRIKPQPDCIIVSYLAPEHWPRMHPARDMLPALEDGRMRTERVFWAPEGKLGTVFFNPRVYFGVNQAPYSNLAKISPEIRIYSVSGRCTSAT